MSPVRNTKSLNKENKISNGMKLNRLSIKDKGIFNKFLGMSRHELSVYAFENTYIWKGLFDIHWALIENSLCVFFKDKMGCFLYLAPLSGQNNPQVIRRAFEILDKFNQNKEISRIENIEEQDTAFYQNLGYNCKPKSYDYLCLRANLAELKGNKFKSQRACCNYFNKQYKSQYLPFSLQHRDGCLKLYNSWMQERKRKNQDRIYQAMLLDSQMSLKVLLDNYSHLDLIARVVKINQQVKAFTFGFKLNADTFCILYEITDLSVKGLSQYIFRQFSSELENYKYINVMDDSGLENLKKVKLSYQPVRLIPAYIVTRRNG